MAALVRTRSGRFDRFRITWPPPTEPRSPRRLKNHKLSRQELESIIDRLGNIADALDKAEPKQLAVRLAPAIADVRSRRACCRRGGRTPWPTVSCVSEGTRTLTTRRHR